MIETLWVYATEKEYRNTFPRPFWRGLQFVCVAFCKASGYGRAWLDHRLGKKPITSGPCGEVRHTSEMTGRALQR
jgi:hypothetical protein